MTVSASFPERTAPNFPLLLQGIGCVRGETHVFRNVSLTLAAGDACVVRGVNGAGKTSLLRLLAGLGRPKSGEANWQDGEAPHDVPERALFIGHQDSLKPALNVAENLAFWASFYGAAEQWPLKNDPFAILPLIHRPVRVLSAGQKRRVSLSRLCLSSANLWLLDEPTTALDAQSQDALWQVIAAHRARGGAVVISSHGEHGLSDFQTLDLKRGGA